MRKLLASRNIRTIFLLLSALLILPIAYCEYSNLDSSIAKETKSLNNFEKGVLQNKLEELIQFKNKFFSRNKKFEDHDDSIICSTCVNTFNRVNKFMKDHYGHSGLIEFANFICKNFIKISSEACQSYIGFYTPALIESLLDHYFTGEYICNYHFICKYDHFKILTAEEYAEQILKNNSTEAMNHQNKLQDIKHVDLIDSNATTWKVLHVSDIHTDLGYEEGSLGNCVDPVCCQKKTTISKLKFLDPKNDEFTDADLAGHWGFMGKCDLPLRTTQNFADFIFSDIDPDFIIWTGDNPSHAEWKSDNQNEVFNVTRLFSDMLKRKSKRTNEFIPVYPSIGNHEKFPIDQFYPFDNKTESPLLKAIGDIWIDFIGEEAYNQFINYGYYSKKHLNTNLRIVSYNCLLCDVVDFYLIKNPNDPNNQLKWLEETLANAELSNEIVYLIGHIPVGDSSFLSECSKRYQILLDRYSHIIRGHFSGHTHFDEVKIMTRFYDEKQTSGMIFIAPSLTTFSYLNPSFRVFEVDSNSKVIKDYLQYGFDLNEANKSKENKPKWEVRYRATELFKVDYISNYEKVKDYVMNVYNKTEKIDNLLKAFFANGPLFDQNVNNKKFPLYMYCRVMKNNMDDYFKCIRYISWDSEEYGFKLLNLMSGKWYERIHHDE